MSDDQMSGRALLVLGMHRSGTSAVARVLNCLGAELGADLLPPAPGNNPKGFWEHSGVVQIHEELLGALGSDWSDLRSLPEGWLDSKAADRARAQLRELLKREFSGSALWAVKDPRACLLAPLWLRVLEELGVRVSVLFVIRHPDEVAGSLLSRDGLGVELTRLNWLKHMAEAEVATRHVSRTAVLYADLLVDWRSVATRIASDLGLEWPCSLDEAALEIDQFLDPRDRHHAVDQAARLPRLEQEVFDALVACARGKAGWERVSSNIDTYLSTAPVFMAAMATLAEDAGKASAAMAGANIREKKTNLELEGMRCVYHALSLHGEAAGMSLPGLSRHQDDYATLYYRSEDGAYEEDRSVKLPRRPTARAAAFEFDIPEGTTVDFVRIDPSNFPGFFRIAGLRLDGNAINDLSDLVTQISECRLEDENAGVIQFVSAGNDPLVEFDLRKVRTHDGQIRKIAIKCHYNVNGVILDVFDSQLDALATAAEKNSAKLEHLEDRLERDLREFMESATSKDQVVIEAIRALQALGVHREEVLLDALKRELAASWKKMISSSMAEYIETFTKQLSAAGAAAKLGREDLGELFQSELHNASEKLAERNRAILAQYFIDQVPALHDRMRQLINERTETVIAAQEQFADRLAKDGAATADACQGIEHALRALQSKLNGEVEMERAARLSMDRQLESVAQTVSSLSAQVASVASTLAAIKERSEKRPFSILRKKTAV